MSSFRGNFGFLRPTKGCVCQGEKEIRKEFSKLDVDNSGFITKGRDLERVREFTF